MSKSLFEYPAEIRIGIYEAIAAHLWSTNPLGEVEPGIYHADRHPVDDTKLSQVSRQVREEWQAVFYPKPELRLDHDWWDDSRGGWVAMSKFHKDWVEHFGDTHLPHMRKIVIYECLFTVQIELDYGYYQLDVIPSCEHSEECEDVFQCRYYESYLKTCRQNESHVRTALDTDLRVKDDGMFFMTAALMERIIYGLENRFHLEYQYLYELPTGPKKHLPETWEAHIEAVIDETSIPYYRLPLKMMLDSMEEAGGEDAFPDGAEEEGFWGGIKYLLEATANESGT